MRLLYEELSSEQRISLRFAKSLRWSDQSNSYFQDHTMGALNTSQFFRGDGARSISRERLVYRYHYEKKGGKFLKLDLRTDPEDNSAESSFPLPLLIESSF